uniref:RRP15-like protein n=1 Tax=Oreochromis aureus TaxID=47969 RepID=A0AAZ1XZU0_OREAU
MDIEAVDSYRYLGVHLNNKLDWTHNSGALYRKGQSRLYLLRRLRSFGVEGPLLKTFYDSVVASAIFYGVVCWGGNISAGDRKRLNRLIRRASSVLGCPLDPVEVSLWPTASFLCASLCESGDNMALWSEGKKEEDENEHNEDANTGWAEAMAKILGKKTTSGILEKNKELEKIKAAERQEQLERKKQADEKKAWEQMCREKPDIVKDRETEKALQRIATRGVVQLFNAVRKHQKTVEEKVKDAGGSDRKKAKILGSVSKKDFIDVLRREEGGVRATGKTEKDAVSSQMFVAAVEKPAWTVLRDDFMMGATMKDWDKSSDQDEPQEGNSEAAI